MDNKEGSLKEVGHDLVEINRGCSENVAEDSRGS